MSLQQRMDQARAVGGVVVAIAEGLELPRRGYDAMVKATISKISDEAVCWGVSSLFENHGLRRTITSQPEHTTIYDKARLEELMARATFEFHGGEFAMLRHGAGSTDFGGKVVLSIFLDACLKPDEVRGTIELLTKGARAQESVNQFQVGHISEMHFCLRLAELTADDRSKSAALCGLAMKLSAASDLSPLIRFSRELIFKREFLPFVADRLLTRVASGALRCRESESQFDVTIRNSMCEFVLVSMGIVPPGLFNPGGSEVLKDITEGQDEDRSLARLGMDLKAEFKARASRRSHPISLDSTNIKFGKNAGDLFGSFLSGAFSQSWPRLRDALGGTEWLSALRGEAQDEKKRSERLGKIFAEGLERPEFQGLVKELIVREWYPALDPYLQVRPQF